MECIFCKIATKKIASKIVFEDDEYIAFNDIKPQAPVHVIIIPKKHIDSLNYIEKEDNALIGGLLNIAKKIAYDQGVSETGYRTVINCNKDAGQEVFHIHLHLIGGRKMSWPPG
ncbi:MAG: histidine triad nucleotide-binding protein [Candidatus Omnitrophica bacterium]|jgi:histidine triad (HIT) family protein|nr:histidine triad nucleotide-binding protein [Candidatus Omnitrophota bacterium]